MRPLEFNTAIVTGAGSGIGRAITLRLISDGAQVLAADKNDQGLRETLELAHSDAGTVHAVTIDVGHHDAPQTLVQTCKRYLGGPTMLINNAGIGGAKPVHQTDDDALDRFTNINLRSVFRISREFVRDLMGEQREGAIVNISSIFALRGFQTSSIYGATKAALIGLTQNMAADYGPNGIRVNAIAPGLIRTGMTAERIDSDQWTRETMLNATPLGRVGQPEEIAAGVAFLCSKDASFITGEVLTIDGGWSATKFQPRS